jgi:hypothetical protein
MTNTSHRPHLSFWIISILALIWNLLGVMNFFGQLNSEVVASMPASHQAIIEGRPVWGTIAFAIAVFGGALGCILLLLRKAVAQYVFIASLLGVMVQMIPNFKLAGSEVAFTLFEMVMMLILPLLVAAFLAWYATQTHEKGWIK